MFKPICLVAVLMISSIRPPLGLAAISVHTPLRPKTPLVRYSQRFVSSLWQRPPESVDLAQAVVKKALAAYGGEAKILSFTDATFQYQVENLEDPTKQPVQMKAYFKDANYFRSEAAGEGADAVTILSRDKGWVKVGDTTLSLSKKNLDPLKAAIISQLRPDLLLLSFQKFRYAGKFEEEGRKLDQVEISGFLSGEYVRGRLSFDSNTHLIYKYEFEIERELPKGKGIVAGEEKYVRYLETEGLKVPAEVASRQGRKTSRLTINQVSFTSVLDPALFEDPTLVATPPASAPKP
ncbi:MAG: hypothetical protein L0387_09980 [Acidobacteria bacterium]|nr:hypothetical protein [Acidobacteriota bacterium]MCI0721532.1 hypothetical protein [Acidobacteriota bacterium]